MLQKGDKPENPRKLSKLSDRGERAKSTHLQHEG
ncbi:hypothetical protein CUC50_22750 [Citrobacter werkmanii]|nr:hypothetical protein CUC50_22750 [Citrobacter werkmanii]